MRMSSSMYEVFNWNSSPDPPLTPAKHKRASLSLPPTTDIFAVDDKSDTDTRRPMIQRVASGESWCLRSLQENRERSVSVRLKNEYCRSFTSRFVLALALVELSPFLSRVLHHYVFHLLHYTLYQRMSRSFNIIKAYPAHFLSVRSSLPDCMVLVSGGFYNLLQATRKRNHVATNITQQCDVSLSIRFLILVTNTN